MGTLRFFEEVVSFKIRRTFGFADYTGQAYENIRQNTQRVLPPIKPETNTFQAAHDTDRHISDALRRHPRRSPGYSYGSARLFSRVPIFTHNRHTDNFFTPAE